MRTGTPIGKNYVTLCIERIFAEEPRQVDHKYAILRNQQQSEDRQLDQSAYPDV